MNSERSNSAIIAQANLDNADEVTKLVDKTLSKNSRIDALINNASTFYPTPIGTFSEESWNALMGSNLKAPLFLIQAFHKELEKNKGFIINITDINVDKALVNHSIYLAAKSGLQTLTKSLAKELAPYIRVNAIAPGAILEPPNTEWTSEQKNNIINGGFKNFQGHTEWIKKKTKSKNVDMLLSSKKISVALATTHIPLAEVAKNIQKSKLRFLYIFCNFC